uniref:Uncharacterized protein n=1 Tax=Rhizophora mucronata TaxID=61149 RepID=A0A2P2QLK3_RHIMU
MFLILQVLLSLLLSYKQSDLC